MIMLDAKPILHLLHNADNTILHNADNSILHNADNTIIQGDFNAKVGKGCKDKNVGAYRLGQRNEKGNRLVEWAKEHGMIIGNTIFCQPPRRLWTWKSPGDNKESNRLCHDENEV